MHDDDLSGQIAASVAELAQQLVAAGRAVAVAESCTGGAIAKVLTDRPGSSAWFGYGFVTYSNAAKVNLLNVPEGVLNEHGAVSAEVAQAMAEGALAKSGADYAVAVTGIAGPDGGSDAKPVGTVWLAWAQTTGNDGIKTKTRLEQFSGDRDQVRASTVQRALAGLIEISGRNE